MIADPFAEHVIYRSADWKAWAPHEPLYAHQHAQLREQCRIALQRRREAYPEMVAERKLKQADADQDIRSWELLLAEWTWVVDGPAADGAELPPAYTLAARIAAVDLALARIAEQLGRGNRSHDMMLQSHLNQALRWHLTNLRHDAPAIHFWAGLTHGLRHRAPAALEQERNAA